MNPYDSDGDTGHGIPSKRDNISGERYRDYYTHFSRRITFTVSHHSLPALLPPFGGVHNSIATPSRGTLLESLVADVTGCEWNEPIGHDAILAVVTKELPIYRRFTPYEFL